MNLLKYTSLFSLLHRKAFYIIKQNTIPEHTLQTDEIKSKPRPSQEGHLEVVSLSVFVFRSLNT